MYEGYQSPGALGMYRQLIVAGAWWDLVDEASGGVGRVLRAAPRQTAARLRSWANGRTLWLRRTAIICQRRFGTKTDLRLLYDCIEPSLASREFFLAKAIGWALRDLAWFDADEVRRYVRANAERLAPLSRREALKNVGEG
jgi:3-methyladenine DNA glycosylase AlkD